MLRFSSFKMEYQLHLHFSPYMVPFQANLINCIQVCHLGVPYMEPILRAFLKCYHTWYRYHFLAWRGTMYGTGTIYSTGTINGEKWPLTYGMDREAEENVKTTLYNAKNLVILYHNIIKNTSSWNMDSECMFQNRKNVCLPSHLKTMTLQQV